ncbi:hypothetical protein CLU79DRAFT_717517 [Phycomyces nitens]|nr:hypothetical protein CLU79DRAFT_717517 [Phycomyces nitens]
MTDSMATHLSPQPSGARTMTVDGKRILCIADARGNLSQLNALARDADAQFIIHTGDFGFYDGSSLNRISDRTLKHLVQYSTLISPHVRTRLNSSPVEQIRSTIEQSPQTLLSEFPVYLSGEQKLDIPVYTVWGACEDVAIIERFRSGEYKIHNLFLLDEATTHLLDIGGVSLRLFGLGGAVVQHKLFDNGEGTDTIAGGLGTMWTTALQIGELVETAQRVYACSETRILVTHASPGREGLLAQLALVLRADFTISAGLHFRYGISYNEFACQPDQEHYRERLIQSQQGFLQLWDAIKEQVESYVDERQTVLLQNALMVVNRLPPSLQQDNAGQPELSSASSSSGPDRDEQAFKNMWNFNLPDAAFGWVVLDVNHGRVSAETRSQGFSFSYRRSSAHMTIASPLFTLDSTSPATEKPNQYKQSEWEEPPVAVAQTDDEWKDTKEDNGGPSGSYGNYKNPKRTSVRNQSHCTNQQRSLYVAYVGGLSNTAVTESEIRSLFGRDTVTAVKFPLDPTTQQPKSHCYVDFSHPVALENALAMNGKLFKDNRLVINRPTSQFGDGRGRGRGRGRNSYRSPRMNEGRVTDM